MIGGIRVNNKFGICDMRMRNMIKTLLEYSDVYFRLFENELLFLIFPQIAYTYVNFQEKVLKYFFKYYISFNSLNSCKDFNVLS